MAEPPPQVPPLPLFASEQAQRAHCARRRRWRRRALPLALGIVALASTIALPPRPLLVWNASASAPIGLYAVTARRTFARGDMAIVRLPASLRRLAARRHYLPRGLPLVKRVAGVAPDRICAQGVRITINGHLAAIRRIRDGLGRPLPQWQGCRPLGAGALFLLMTGRADSFDGRYFGISEPGDIIGKATPLWLP
ncbi:S26 family signal peptidase [Novosphingobium sp. M1R2S20]|uniref:S26 family signal peptidase n=1 Tax=Novosphingobium rhizovicinum TaxID=3228928 RepID=A0ABV3RF13_9SPHN